MVKKVIFSFSLLASTCACTQNLYKIEENKNGEPLLNDKAKYSFNEMPTLEDLRKIDTSSYYIQKFSCSFDREDLIENPRIIIFHNDGFFKNESLIYFGKFDLQRGKNSVYYGGKYKITENTIEMEQFGKYPGYKKWYRKISVGKIEGNKIIFNDENSISVFEKSSKLPVN